MGKYDHYARETMKSELRELVRKSKEPEITSADIKAFQRLAAYVLGILEDYEQDEHEKRVGELTGYLNQLTMLNSQSNMFVHEEINAVTSAINKELGIELKKKAR